MDDAMQNVSEAERLSNDIYKQVNGIDHRWLKEHIEYGIPTSMSVEKTLKKHNLSFAKTTSNDLLLWFAMQSGFFIKSALDNGNNFLQKNYVDEFLALHRKMNEFYNNHHYLIDTQKDRSSYRTIYFISKDQSSTEKMQKYINTTNSNRFSETQEIERATLELFGIIFGSTSETVKILQSAGNKLEKKLQIAEQKNEELAQLINAIESSKSWQLTKPLRKTHTFIQRLKTRI